MRNIFHIFFMYSKCHRSVFSLFLYFLLSWIFFFLLIRKKSKTINHSNLRLILVHYLYIGNILCKQYSRTLMVSLSSLIHALEEPLMIFLITCLVEIKVKIYVQMYQLKIRLIFISEKKTNVQECRLIQ